MLNQDVKHLKISPLPIFHIIYNKRKQQQLKDGINNINIFVVTQVHQGAFDCLAVYFSKTLPYGSMA